jgi:hypothetical protein
MVSIRVPLLAFDSAAKDSPARSRDKEKDKEKDKGNEKAKGK